MNSSPNALSNALSGLKQLSSNTALPVSPLEATPIPKLIHSNSASPCPNIQQKTVLDAPLAPSTITAYAGCGKTTLLRWLAEKYAPTHKIGYIALNTSVANQAQQLFGPNAICKTSHSLALAWLRQNSNWRSALNASNRLTNLSTYDIIQALQIQGKKRFVLAGLLKQTVQNFIGSKHSTIQSLHIPELFIPLQSQINVTREQFLEQAWKLWQLMSSPNGTVALTHDGYLKLWSLQGAPVPFDLLLLDEAQDTNEAMAHALTTSSSILYLVGDPHQAIYSFRGSINAMKIFEPSTQQFSLSQTQRFGGNIKDAVNALLFLKGAKEPIQSSQTKGSINNMGIPPNTSSLFISRSNMGLFSQALLLTQRSTPFTILGDAPFFNLNPQVIQHIVDLTKGKPWDNPTYGTVTSIDQLEQLAQLNQDNQTILNVALSKQFGVTIVQKAQVVQNKSQNQTHALITLSTTHKAKGLQAPWVELSDDFLLPAIEKPTLSNIPKEDMEEANIFYVALTRAQQGIYAKNPSQYQFLNNLVQLSKTPQSALGLSLEEKAKAEGFVLKDNISPTTLSPVDLPKRL